MDLNGKVAIVTGASRGVGAATAIMLAERGCRVVCAARATDAAPVPIPGTIDETVRKITDAGGTAVAVPTNLAKDAEVEQMIAATVDHFGPVDILVNNAAITFPGDLDLDMKRFDLLMQVDLRAPLLAIRAVMGSMKERRTGSILNISSIAGLNGNPPEMQTLAYNTSKTAVIGFTHTLAAEWGKYNINVNAICPGFFMTKMAAGLIKSIGEDKMAAHAPLGRLGDDEDLKGVTLLYASDAGKHITGQWLAVDGGVSVVLGA